MGEYECLREEILKDYEGIRQYECVMYTVVVAVLAFAIESGHYILCMIPYIIIMPIFHIVMGTKQGISKAATYMIVFLEGNDYHWETLHKKYDEKYIAKKNDSLKWQTHSQYYLLSSVCSLLTMFMLIINNSYSTNYKISVSLGVTAFTLIMFRIIYKNTFIYETTKPLMIDNWEKIKAEYIKKQHSPIEINSTNAITNTNE